MAKTQELDLYASPGLRESFNLKSFGWKGWLGLSVAVVAVLFGLFRLWLKVPLPKGPWGF